MPPTLKQIESDEGFLGLPPNEQDEIRLKFLRKFVLADEGFQGLAPAEKARIASRVMNIREPSRLNQLVELVPEIQRSAPPVPQTAMSRLTLKDVESDEEFQALPADAKERVRLGFVKEHILPDPQFSALTPDEKRQVIQGVLDIKEPSRLSRFMELIPEIRQAPIRPGKEGEPTFEEVALASGGIAQEPGMPSRMRPLPAPSSVMSPEAAEAESIATEQRLRAPVPTPPLVVPPGIERPEQPTTEAELRRAGSVVVPPRTPLQQLSESKPGTAIASAWAELPEMKIAQALGAVGVDLETKEQLAEDLGANPTLLDKTLRSATSILGSPLSMAAFAWGGLQVPAKAVQASLARVFGPRVASETMATILAGSATSAQKFATFEGVVNAADQLKRWKETGEVPSVTELAKSMGKGAVVGAAMGPTAAIPGRVARTAAQAATLGTVAPMAEGRTPTIEDLLDAGALVAALGLTHALPEAVSRALSTPATQRTPEQRRIALEVAKGLESIRRAPIAWPSERALEAPPAEIAEPSSTPAVEPPTVRTGVEPLVEVGVTTVPPGILRQISEAANQAVAREFIVTSEDGRTGKILVAPSGTVAWQAITNPKSLREASQQKPGRVELTIPGGEFEGIFPRNPEGYAPGMIEANRQQFVLDEGIPTTPSPTARGRAERVPRLPEVPPTEEPTLREEARVTPTPSAPQPRPIPAAPPEPAPSGSLGEALEYVKTIKGLPKQNYATEYLGYLSGLLPDQPPVPKTLPTRGALEVRAELERIYGSPRETPETIQPRPLEPPEVGTPTKSPLLERLRQRRQASPVAPAEPRITKEEPVGLDSTLRAQKLQLGENDRDVLSEMEDSAKAAIGAEAGKVFRDVSQEYADREGPRVLGFKTGKPDWMQVEGNPGEYYGTPEVLKVLEKLKAGNWPKTARQERIASQLLDAVRFDAQQEKSRIAGYEAEAKASEVQAARDRDIQGAFFREVDRLAAEEQGRPTPVEGARPSLQQPEMFTGREMIGPAVTPGKKGTEVPQAATGDELLEGMRRPEVERQIGLPVPETFSVGDAVRYRPTADQSPTFGRIAAVHEDGTVNVWPSGGGPAMTINPAEGGLTTLASVPRAAAKGGAAGASVAAASAARTIPPKTEVPRQVAKPTQKPTVKPGTESILVTTAKGIVEVADDIRKVFAPQTRGPEAKETALILREHAADLAQRTDRAHEALRKAHSFFAKQDAGSNYAFMDRVERGEPQGGFNLDRIAGLMRQLLDGRRKEIQDLGTGKLTKFYEHYFPHIWQDPKAAQGFIAQFLGKRSLEGSRTFLKSRSLPTIADGLEAGLVPVSDNPVDLVLLKVREMDKYIMAHRAFAEMKEKGLAKFVPIGQEAPEGYARIEDRIATVYGKPTVTVKEAFDQQVMERLTDLADSLDIQHERKPRIGGRRWGFAEEGPLGGITTKFAGPESVVEHEIGHILDKRYDLWNVLIRDVEATGKRGTVTKTASQKQRATIQNELRALADLRYEGQEVSPGFKQYVRKAPEKIANLIQALIYAPEKLHQVAPTVAGRLKDFIRSHEELQPLLEIKPSLVLGEAAAEIPVGGLVIHGQYWAPEPAARVVNNYLSPGLREKSAIARGFIGAGNVLNQFQLGWSGFHLGFTTLDAAISKSALGLYQIMHGKPIEGLKSMVETPISPVTNLLRGDKMLKEWFSPGSQGEEIARLVEALRTAGGRVQLDPFYKTNITNRMLEALYNGSLLGKAGAALRLPFAITEQVSRPIFEYIVPRQKLGVFADLARFELERLGPDATTERIREALAKAWDSTDNRLGQLVYDNLFWNKTAKDLAFMTVRSVGWNLGTLRELGGGVADLLRGDFSFRASYVFALPLVAGIIGATLQYIMTGKGPDEWRDYYYPETGNKDEHGRPERVSIPSYMKDVVHAWKEPGQTVLNKTHPLVNLVSEMLRNRDYYGTKIRNEDDPIIQQLLDVAEHVGESFKPFALRGFEREQKLGGGPIQRFGPFVGITPAPTALNLTPAEALAREYLQAKLPAGARTKEQFERSQALREMTRDIRLGKDIREKKQEALKSGIVSRKDVGELRERAKTPPLVAGFRQLTVGEAAHVYEVASDGEKQILKARLREKIINAHGKPHLLTSPVRQLLERIGFRVASPVRSQGYEPGDTSSADRESEITGGP